jgi:hypothetical protein
LQALLQPSDNPCILLGQGNTHKQTSCRYHVILSYHISRGVFSFVGVKTTTCQTVPGTSSTGHP